MAGIPITSFKYPTELTNKDWQKKKGKLAKMKKTGLGAELEKAEALFKKINLTDLDPASSPSKSLDDLNKKVTAAKASYAKTVPALMKQMTPLQNVAKAAQKKLNGKAAKAAADIEKSAKLFAVTCKSIDLEASIAKVKADIEKKNALAAKLLGASVKKFIAGAKAFLKAPSIESWGKNIKQQGRSVSNSVAQLENYRAQFWKDFEKFKGFDLNTLGISGEDDKAAKLRIAVVKKAVQQVIAIGKFKG